jgi:hypothetical protein
MMTYRQKASWSGKELSSGRKPAPAAAAGPAPRTTISCEATPNAPAKAPVPANAPADSHLKGQTSRGGCPLKATTAVLVQSDPVLGVTANISPQKQFNRPGVPDGGYIRKRDIAAAFFLSARWLSAALVICRSTRSNWSNSIRGTCRHKPTPDARPNDIGKNLSSCV